VASTYRTRFAPSPTGKMHMGHARTALVTWLQARRQGGEIIMRIEDIDGPRVVEGAADGICRDHEWLGLDWDDGPMFQSSRGSAYERALAKLDEAGLVYPCTCSRKEIARIASAPHGGEGLRYPGTCRNGVSNPDRKPSLRFRFPESSPGFEDVLHGVFPDTEAGGDFVLRRADGIWAYQLAVVVDDAETGVTEVIRGDDLLSSTPKQIALYRALGYPVPRFAHLGLVLDERGERLATRHGAPSIESMRQAGRSSEGIIGELAYSLGITATAAPTEAAALVSGFNLATISNGSFTWKAKA